MQVSTKAIVISRIRYGDYDLIVKCYSEDYGLRSYIIKRAFKSKKTKLKPAYFQPLSILYIEAIHKENRQLHYLKEVKIAVTLNSIYTNVVKSAVAIFLSEILAICLNEEEKNDSLFNFIESSIIWYDTNSLDTSFHLLFMLDLTKYLGFYPDVTNINAPYFNMLEGKFQTEQPTRYNVTGENLTVLKRVLGIKFDRGNKLHLTILQKREFLDMILVYFKLHLSGFKTPKSLTILNQVFR